MDTNHRISSTTVIIGMGRRLLQILLLLGCSCLAGQSAAWANEKQDAREKISGVILAHQQQKIRPAGMAAAQHRERLHRLGLNADVLDAEQAALYVDNPLTDDEIADLAEQGIKINVHAWVPAVPGKHAHGFYLASVKYDALDSLRDNARVVFVESVESVSRPLNFAGRAMTNADDVFNGNGVTARDGTGVHLAVLDSGFDLSHADFPTPVEAFDMTNGTDPNTWGTNVSNTVMDHGTHVAGTALGGGVLSPQYQGAAPGVSWYAYKIGNNTNAGANDSDMIEAIVRFDSLSLSGPKVLNMSYGALVHLYSDGSSSVEQAIDSATANGVTCVIAAGNDQSTGLHASVNVAPGATSGTYSLLIDNTFGSSSYAGPEDIRVIWRDGVSDGNMVLTATSLSGGETLTNSWSISSVRGTESKQYLLNINPVPAGMSRTYTFTLQNTAGGGVTPLVHTYRTDPGLGTFTNPDPFYTINHPATADSAIAVGAWTQASSWTDYQGNFWNYNWLSVNTLTSFSSQGPRIDGVQKPDIVAPGAVTISVKDSNIFGSPAGCDPSSGYPLNCMTIDNNGSNDGNGPADYIVEGFGGTSMASPHVAGVIALALEAAPTMTPAQVKAALSATAAHPGAPSNSDGAGLIDALALIQIVDCNDNGVYDVTEVGDGSTSDCDGNGRPDACDLVSGAMSYDYVGYNAGSVPASVLAMADFDGDGERDAAMAMPGESGNPIRFMWNNGDGTFSAVNQYVDGTFWSIAYLAAGDFDQDGDVDLVISMSSSVRILDNDGSGAFTLAGNLFGSIGDYRLSVIDLNLDTYPDLVYLRSWFGADEFGVSLNNGDGTFPQPTVTNLADPAREVVFGDVDNDGDPDMIIAMGHNNTAGDVLVLLNQGDGSFATAIQYPVSGGPISLDMGDLDTDGDLDVVVRSVIASGSNHWNSVLDLLINDGTGSFTQPGGQNAPSLLATNLYAAPLIVADANGDLIPDIVVGGPGQHPDLGILANDGNANFTLVPTTFSPWGPSTASALVAEDFDSSGTMDFLVIEGGTVAALWGTATPPFDTDCNANGVPDSCEIGDGSAQDCQSDGIPDACQLAGNDCNGNGDPDDCDISSGGSSDNNGNGVPDECEGGNTCPADSDGDGDVDAADLAQLLGNWGSYGSCPPYVAQDFDQDCDVDAADLAQLLGAWGACP